MLSMSRGMLGIAVDEGFMRVAQVRMSRRRTVLDRAAEFTFPEGVGLDDPAALGRALRAFLRRHHFTARRAVVGMPARWLLTREERLPRASGKTLTAMLRAKAEQAFSIATGELALDYALNGESETSLRALLVGSPARRVGQVAAAVRAARLRAVAVTPSIVALANATAAGGSSRVVLDVGRRSVEYAFVADGRPRAVRRLPVNLDDNGKGPLPSDEQAGRFAASLRHALTLLPRDGEMAEPDEVVVWDGAGFDPEALGLPGEGLSASVTVESDISSLRIDVVSASMDDRPARFAAAVALALTGAGRLETSVDFLHSRMAPARRTAPKKRLAWAAAVALALALFGASQYMDRRAEEESVNVLRQRLAEMRGDIDDARAVVERVAYARSWYDPSPQFLERLRRLTLAFPEAGTIWATSLAIREDGHAVLSGRSEDEKSVLAVLDRLKSTGAFSDLKLLYARRTGGRLRGVSFAIRFTCAVGG